MLEMNILWVSANRLGYELLKEAIKVKGIKIAAIITLGRSSKTIMYDGVKEDKWNEFDVDVHRIKQLNKEKELIKKISPDLMVICGWRQIIAKDIIDIPPKGIVGFHPSLLPYGRGCAPIINTILKGDVESGLTLFYITEGLDDGDIIAQNKFSITETDFAQDVYDKAIEAGKLLIRKYFPMIIKENVKAKPQDRSKAVVFRNPKFRNNKINPKNETLIQIYRKIKAFSKPYKGAYIEKDGKRLIIWKAELRGIK